jgi:4-hydroxy-tetrahydrodipicolinate synthase
MDLKQTLSGTGVAIVTPFQKDLTVDYAALEKLIDHLIANGVNYIVTMGTTGETPTLSAAEKKDIIVFTYEKVNDRVPVVVGIGGNNTAAVVQDLKDYPLQGATAVLSASPYYNKPSQEGLYQHYKALAEASSKPIMLYNVPGRTSRNLSAATTIRLAQLPNIAGIKEASGDMVQCMHIINQVPNNFLVVSGDDHLTLPLIAAGMQGVISVAANSFPKAFCQMVQCCLQKDFEKARALHYQLLQGMDLLFEENNPAGVKAFLAEQGLIENLLRLPVTPVQADLHEKIKAFAKTLL